MPYNTKTVKRDGSGITPVPQHFNPTADDYEAILGRNGASRAELYGPDGNPISTSAGKLAVRASEVESLLNDIKGKDFATQTTLAAILAKIIAAPATEAKQDTIIGHVDGIEGSVDGIETALGTLLTLAGYNAKADITQSALRDAIRGTSNKTLTDIATALTSVATAAKQDAMAALIGALSAAAVTDPTSTTAVLIALIKGLMKQMQGGGTGSMPVQLSGSNAIKGALATVTTGERVQLPDYSCKEVTVIARRDNTGIIYVGGDDVSSSVYGISLSAEQSFTFQISNTNLLYIDASVSGEGISYVAI